MRALSPIYICCQCKSIKEKIEDLYFVEENSSKGFCSETCIEKFYDPIVAHYKKIEEGLQKKFVSKHYLGELMDSTRLLDDGLKNPHEIWVLKNDLGEEVFTYIANINDKSYHPKPFSLIVVCFTLNFNPSFIFLASLTDNPEFINSFRFGEKVADMSAFISDSKESEQIVRQSIELDEMERKKSSYLAKLLEKHSESDISFEHYPLYEEFFEQVLNGPDEVYEALDDDGDKVFTLVKACEKNGVSFFYLVLCVGENLDSQDGDQTLIPILGFPSLDGELCNDYRKGERISGGPLS